MMTRVMQVLFVIVAAVVCAAVVGCKSAGRVEEGRLLSDVEVEGVLVGVFPELATDKAMHTEDHGYLTVSAKEVWAAVNVGWEPHVPESWDCDDQAAGVLHALRVSCRGLGAAPAAGRLTGLIRGGPHAVIWWIDHGLRLRLLDASNLTPVHASQVVARFAFDK